MPREPEKYLHDIWVAGSRVQQFVHGKTYDDYLKDELLRAGVERQFEIMGEALNQLAKISPHIAESIPEYRRIISFRNILIHGYADVDNALVWGVVESKLPALMHSVSNILHAKGQ